jgi:DNA repair exonuclease SbcCD ATPase subunit
LEIRLKQLSLKNFKGLKQYTFTPNGKNAVIKGDNATGKSTIADSFLWLAFGKNSTGQSDFSVKPLDENNNEIHFLETEVEAELTVDGKPLKLKKVLTENWVKPRGQENQEYKGNNTMYFFDEVPVGANEYKAKIGAIIDEDTFKLITNPMYFNSPQYKIGKLTDWQSRRVKLFEICGNLSDDEIISVTPSLSRLPEVLNGKSVDDRKAIIKLSISKLNEEIDKTGPKINENQRLVPEVATDYSITEKELSGLKEQLAELDKQLSDAGSMVAELQKKQRELFTLKGQLDKVKARIDEEVNSGRKELLVEKQKLHDEKFTLEGNLRQGKNALEEYKRTIQTIEKHRNDLLTIYNDLKKEKTDIYSREFAEIDQDNFVCPTCKQALPEDAKEQKIKELWDNFERTKEYNIQSVTDRINANISNGKSCKEKLVQYQNLVSETEAKIPEAEARLTAIQTRVSEIEEILMLPSTTPNYLNDAEYRKAAGEVDKLQSELEKPIADTTAGIRQKKQDIQSQIDRCNYILNNRDVAATAQKRIEELKRQEKDMSAQKSTLQGQLFLMDEFIRAKAELLSESINRRFKHVRFKLFEIQINGQLNEICEVLVNTNGCWVPFSDGNTAGKINAGVDIVSSLIEFHGVSAPIFCDNAEAITDIIPVDTQMIKLVKPEITTDEDRQKYSRLNVELEV